MNSYLSKKKNIYIYIYIYIERERERERERGFAVIFLLNLINCCPLVGTKHQSHQDYLERADKARSQRLSSGSSSAK